MGLHGVVCRLQAGAGESSPAEAFWHTSGRALPRAPWDSDGFSKLGQAPWDMCTVRITLPRQYSPGHLDGYQMEMQWTKNYQLSHPQHWPLEDDVLEESDGTFRGHWSNLDDAPVAGAKSPNSMTRLTCIQVLHRICLNIHTQ